MSLQKGLLCSVCVCTMERVAGTHAPHREKLKFRSLSTQLRYRFKPIDLRFLPPAITLRHKDLAARQTQLALSLTNIPSDCWLTDGKLRILPAQPNPYPMGGLPLLPWCLPVDFQHAVDVFFDRTQPGLFPNCFLPVRRDCTADRLTDHPPVNAVLLCQSLYRLSACVPKTDLLE